MPYCVWGIKCWRHASALVLCSVLSSAAAALPATHEFTLDNGLNVVVREDHRAPVVVVQVWYRVGSSDELPGQTGLSHALEHMMFKGTEKVPGAEFSRIVAMVGGQDNAFTTDDYTAYYQVHTADRLSLALELEADRMQGLLMTPDDFAQEIRVVMEERRQRTDDSPDALTYERFITQVFPTLPARNPTIGWMSDLQAMTLDDAKRWYRQWYVPNNATLVIVGDVDADAVQAQVKHFFGPLQARELPPRRVMKELPAPGERRLTLNLPARVPALYVGFNVPSLRTAPAGDAEALRLLAGVLDGGISARLETRLVREQRVAAAIATSYDPFARGDSVFLVRAVPTPGQSLEDLERAILVEIERLKTEALNEAELKRVYATELADDVFSRDSIQEQANAIGRLESVGVGWGMLERWPMQLKTVTAADMQAVAQRYFVPAQRTVAWLLPLPPEGMPPPPPPHSSAAPPSQSLPASSSMPVPAANASGNAPAPTGVTP